VYSGPSCILKTPRCQKLQAGHDSSLWVDRPVCLLPWRWEIRPNLVIQTPEGVQTVPCSQRHPRLRRLHPLKKRRRKRRKSRNPRPNRAPFQSDSVRGNMERKIWRTLLLFGCPNTCYISYIFFLFVCSITRSPRQLQLRRQSPHSTH
jgi:hypothetical protein